MRIQDSAEYQETQYSHHDCVIQVQMKRDEVICPIIMFGNEIQELINKIES